MLRFITNATLLLLILLTPIRSALATGTEFMLSGSDLIVNLNTKWIGCQEGGYYPIRVSIRNNGKARTITLEAKTNIPTQKVPTVTRSVTLEQNATINSSLLIPMVSSGTYLEFRVLEHGRPLKNLSQLISLPEVFNGYNGVGPATLIVASKAEDIELFNQAVNYFFISHSPYSHSSISEYTQHVRPKELPGNWLSYTGLDLLVIPLKNLTQDVAAETQDAIFQWVASGGNLLIYNVAESISESASLENILDWKHRAFAEKKWTPFQQNQFSQLSIIDALDAMSPETENATPAMLEDFSTGAPWEMSAKNYGIRSLGLGKVIALSNNPFPGTISHWNWLMNHISKEQLLWHHRNGIVARAGNESFFHFLIPNVGRVPIFSLLALITIFTILIGPVNYIYYLKKRRLAMLLITVPVIALGSSLTLLSYSTIIHGFSVKSRVRSVTFLDQKQQHATSISRVAYFAGMAPSAGLRFEPTTAVYPIWPVEDSFETGRVDWSETQHLQNGWLRSRTRTQFLTVSQQEQRGRIDLQSSGRSTPKVSNGLEWNIESLLIIDQAGKAWMTKNLKSGAVANLEPVSQKYRSELRKFLSEHEPELPSNVTKEQISDELMTSSRSSYYGNQELQENYKQSLQEKFISRLSSPNTERNALQSGSYFAILKQSPDLELGLKNSKQKASVHLLFGFF